MDSLADLSTHLTPFPDHTQLSESDGTFVKSFQAHPQSILLTDSLQAVLQQHHPDGQYAIGQDSGIDWRETNPLEKGAVAPDWFYVPNVPPLLDGQIRRSHGIWQKFIALLIVLEFVSGEGKEERDRTPWTGKFWVYEQIIRPAFYGIYEVQKASIEVYQWVGRPFQLVAAHERGHSPCSPLQVELGIWQGQYHNMTLPWLRWWDAEGSLLPTGNEQAEQANQQLEQEHQRPERLAAKLRALEIDPEA